VLYNIHRWYSPGVGRYTRPDPLRVRPGGLTYIYVRNAPLILVDPFGLKEVRYDGCTVYYYDDDGNLVRTCPASSGLPGTTVEDQGRPYEGPVPEGKYYIRPWEFSGGWRAVFRAPGWGWWRVPLHPAPGTDTRDRDGFFFHGDRRQLPGTLGCIDVGDCDTWARGWIMEEPSVSVPLYVKYEGRVCN